MNDLLSKTFSRRPSTKGPYVDLRFDNVDLEAPPETEMAGRGSPINLEPFFGEVNSIRSEMESVKKLLHKLQNANEESKTVTRAQAMKALRERMDKDIGEVLRKAKVIKSRLDELDKANLANRRFPGCEQGSSTDRTRMAMTNTLRKNLKDLMGDFQTLRQDMNSEYKQTIGRRYYTVTGNYADDETIDHMIDTGESETFLQKAIQEQGRGQVIDTIKEIQERHETVKEIEKNLIELHQIFLDMAVLVEAQGEELNNIEAAVQGASSFVDRGTKKLENAKVLQKSSRKWTCIGLIILLVVILVVVVPLVVKLIPSNSGASTTTTPSPPPPPATSSPSPSSR